MPETSLIPIEDKNKIKEAWDFIRTITSVKFTNDSEYDNGTKLCISLKKHKEDLEARKEKLYRPHKNVIDNLNKEYKIIAELEQKEKIFKSSMGRYYQEKERKRLKDQRQLDAEAEERRRQEEEKARKEQEKADAYRKQGRDKMADHAEARAETAQTIASTVTAPIVTNSSKVAGSTFKKVYTAKVTDKKAAIQHMMMNDVLIAYLEIDIKGLERLINAQKGRIEINGIKVIEGVQVGLRIK